MKFDIQVMIMYEADGVEGVKDEIESWGIPEGAQVSVSAMVPSLVLGVRNSDGTIAQPPPPEPPEPGPPPEFDPIEP